MLPPAQPPLPAGGAGAFDEVVQLESAYAQAEAARRYSASAAAASAVVGDEAATPASRSFAQTVLEPTRNAALQRLVALHDIAAQAALDGAHSRAVAALGAVADAGLNLVRLFSVAAPAAAQQEPAAAPPTDDPFDDPAEPAVDLPGLPLTTMRELKERLGLLSTAIQVQVGLEKPPPGASIRSVHASPSASPAADPNCPGPPTAEEIDAADEDADGGVSLPCGVRRRGDAKLGPYFWLGCSDNTCEHYLCTLVPPVGTLPLG